MISVPFKMFVERVFGIPVPAIILKVNPKYILVKAEYQGHVWRIKKLPDTTIWYTPKPARSCDTTETQEMTLKQFLEMKGPTC